MVRIFNALKCHKIKIYYVAMTKKRKKQMARKNERALSNLCQVKTEMATKFSGITLTDNKILIKFKNY